MVDNVKDKVSEIEKNFGGANLGLVGAEMVYGERFHLRGREYCDFVRFWTMVICELKKRCNEF